VTRKIWELHAALVGNAIRSTPEGHADVGGLILSEKAYLLAVRDFRPHQLVEMVRRDGPLAVADRLIAHFSAPAALETAGGRSLVSARGPAPGPFVCRSDEVAPLRAPKP
jgi:hypothetical protein